ncbi:MAG: hypothetical protein GX610_06025 [Rhodococcus sp.]|nr:hypothetical protein [Rhodococcus sp. (in: high G+C Gram-positive bacteria)]
MVSTSLINSAISRYAFGDRPGDLPIPAPVSVEERWMHAVVLGGQGRYAAARAGLDELLRRERSGPVASLASSTRASLLRQTGWHRQASAWDGRALAVLAGVEDRDRGLLFAAARCDALTGLAADALGCGRLALGWQLLGRCQEDLMVFEDRVGAAAVWRQRVRLHWVSAELALAGADFGEAGRHARAASEIAERAESVRHRVKSDLLLAATMTGEPDARPAAELAGNVLTRAERHGLVPLKWAASMLLSGVTFDSSWEAEREACELLIRRRGGRFNV